MPKTCPKTVLPEPRPESDRRRRLLPTRGARLRRAATAKSLTMSSIADGSISLERRLGRSDVVEVWSATLDDLGHCAVKFPTARWTGHAGAARLIERESEFIGRATHPGVVSAMGLVPMPTGPGLVLEYLPGGDLVALAGSHPRHWAGCARCIVQALAHVHRCGIVHGDVKPRNVLLDAGGHAKLIDFGLAHDAGAERPAGGGTSAYQRAAQRLGAHADPADDVHALAVMTYELLCGRLPFGSAPDARALETPPTPPLEVRPAYADEPTLVELAALIERLLNAAARAEKRPLAALDALLAAIMVEPD